MNLVNSKQETLRKIKSIWASLIAQLLLGLVIKFYGGSTATSGSMFVKMALIIHIINGVFLVYGGGVLFLIAVKSRVFRWQVTALGGLVSIIVAGMCGVIKVFGTEVSSFASSTFMAVGFVGAFFSYGLFIMMMSYLPMSDSDNISIEAVD